MVVQFVMSFSRMGLSSTTSLALGAAAMLLAGKNFWQRRKRSVAGTLRFHIFFASVCLLTAVAYLVMMWRLSVLQHNFPWLVTSKPSIIAFLVQEVVTAPFMLVGLGQLAGCPLYRTIPSVVCTWIAFAFFVAAQGAWTTASHLLLLLSGSLSLILVLYEFMNWAAHAVKVSCRNAEYVQKAADMCTMAGALIPVLLEMVNLGCIGADQSVMWLIFLDVMFKIGSGHLMLKHIPALEEATRFLEGGKQD